jgi:hypothetical protein
MKRVRFLLTAGLLLSVLLGSFPALAFARCKTWWVCVYKDGTRVYNHIRCYRTYSHVAASFHGRLRTGDCDSVSYGCGECPIRHICYPSQAAYMIKKHGPIIRIAREDPPYDPEDGACDSSGDGERRECD